MLWNSNMGIDYSDYKMAALQAAGWQIRKGTEIESVGSVTYIAIKGNNRVVISFNEDHDLIKLTGSTNQNMGAGVYSQPYSKEATEQLVKYFKAI